MSTNAVHESVTGSTDRKKEKRGGGGGEEVKDERALTHILVESSNNGYTQDAQTIGVDQRAEEAGLVMWDRPWHVCLLQILPTTFTNSNTLVSLEECALEFTHSLLLPSLRGPSLPHLSLALPPTNKRHERSNVQCARVL